MGMVKYKLSSMRWEFHIKKYPSSAVIEVNEPFLFLGFDGFRNIKTKKEARKRIHSFCKVNGIKSYGINE